MALCYKKLWKLLIDHDMTRADLRGATGIAPATIAKMGESASADIITDPELRHKKTLGQFFTEGSCWLRPQVVAFIRATKCKKAYDPFAGTGCLFDPVRQAVPEIEKCIGLDIDRNLGWPINDSLVKIPHEENAVIVTNPPYISNYSAARKKIGTDLKKYFDSTDYDDVYLLALDKMLEAQKNVVAIIPETFINSPYRQKHLLKSITILEDNPFLDTDTPVVVVCFDSIEKPYSEIQLYKDSEFVCTLDDVERCRMVPDNSVKLKFNDPDGWLGVRCVDTTDPNNMLHFDFKENIDYNWEKGIKVSSRLLTLISMDVPEKKRQAFIDECNSILDEVRTRSHDIILSPFKGNMKNGVRRRRLDFMTCRAIIERAYHKVVDAKKAKLKQAELF